MLEKSTSLESADNKPFIGEIFLSPAVLAPIQIHSEILQSALESLDIRESALRSGGGRLLSGLYKAVFWIDKLNTGVLIKT